MTGSRGGDAAPRRRLAPQQTVAPLGRVERALGGEDRRPRLRQDFEKAADDLPMRGEIRRARGRAAARNSAPSRRHGVEKPGERSRRVRRPGRAAAGRSTAQPRPSRMTSRVSSRRRRSSGIAGGTASVSLVAPSAADQSQLVSIEVADRPHPRQQQRRSGLRPSAVGAETPRATRAPRAGSAAARSSAAAAADRRRPVAAARRAKRRQKRPVRRDRVDVRGGTAARPRYRSMRCEERRARVAASPSGVPT